MFYNMLIILFWIVQQSILWEHGTILTEYKSWCLHIYKYIYLRKEKANDVFN